MKATQVLVALMSLVFTASSFAIDKDSFKFAEEAKNYIVKENSKLKRSPNDDFEKVHKICGKPWYKGCNWKKAGGDKWTFQPVDGGKIYEIPKFLMK